jgi:hypothetical protein
MEPLAIGRLAGSANARLKKALRVRCDVRIYPLQVMQQQKDWPEKYQRRRI